MDKKCGPKMLPSDTKKVRNEKQKKIRALKEINKLAERLLDGGLSCDIIKARMISRSPTEPAETIGGQGSENYSHSSSSTVSGPRAIDAIELNLSTQLNRVQSNDILQSPALPPSPSDWLTELPPLDYSVLGETSTLYNDGISNFPSENAPLWLQQLQFDIPSFSPTNDFSDTDFNFLMEQIGQG
jgi:hypothetical protein